MSVTELIELLLLRHRGGVRTYVFNVFDPDEVCAVYLDLILGWFLVEEAVPIERHRSGYLVDSTVVLTEKGRQRLAELEAKVAPLSRRTGRVDRRRLAGDAWKGDAKRGSGCP